MCMYIIVHLERGSASLLNPIGQRHHWSWRFGLSFCLSPHLQQTDSDFKTSLIWTIHLNKQQPNVNFKKKIKFDIFLIFWYFSEMYSNTWEYLSYETVKRLKHACTTLFGNKYLSFFLPRFIICKWYFFGVEGTT